MTDVEILESTYFDLCTIKRKVKVKDPATGVTTTEEKVIVENVKCALSKDKRTNLMSVDGVGNVSESYMLFIGPKVDLKSGDTIIVNSLNGVQSFTANKPFTYQSHTECYLTLKERV